VTPTDDYVDGMETPLLDDEAIEAFFLGTGQSGWAPDDALATLAEEVLVATGGPPPRPRGGLLAFLDDAAPAACTAPALVAVPIRAPAATTPWQHKADVAPATPTHRTNVRLLLTRRLRVTAGIAAGIGIAAAALTVAGTTGVLPDPAMRAIVRVVEAVTPFEVSEPTKPPAPTVSATQPATTSVPATPGTGSDAVGQSGSAEQAPPITPPSGPPASLPATVPEPGLPGSTGVDRASQTPAAPFIPPFVADGPPPPPPEPTGDRTSPPDTGADRARETPAGTFIPPFAGGPPGRR
jgi:hypothetical protein